MAVLNQGMFGVANLLLKTMAYFNVKCYNLMLLVKSHEK